MAIIIQCIQHLDAVQYCRSSDCVADKLLYTIGLTIIVLRTQKKNMQEWDQVTKRETGDIIFQNLNKNIIKESQR